MELQILNDKENPMLNRREILLKVTDRGTPPRIEVKNKLAALLNSRPELIVIERLDGVFGKLEVIGRACIYQSEERLKQVAHHHLTARDAPKEKPAEAPEAKPEEVKPEAGAKPKEVKPEAEAKPKEVKPEAEAKPKEVKPEAEAKHKEAKPKEAKPEAEAKQEAKPKAEGKKKSEEK